MKLRIKQEPAMLNWIVVDDDRDSQVIGGPFTTEAEANAFVIGVEWRDEHDDWCSLCGYAKFVHDPDRYAPPATLTPPNDLQECPNFGLKEW